MDHEDFKIELFVFPDGSEVEIIVFDRPSHGRGGASSAAPATASPAAPARASSAAPATAPPQARPAPPPCCAPSPPPVEDPDAGRCPKCGSTLVYPVDWSRSGPACWTLALRCPECETRREVTLGRASVERLNREIHQSARTLGREADHLTRRNFEDEVSRIVDALERDLILPMDF